MMSDTFTVIFDPDLSPEQIEAVLKALADYYRACGGLGLRVEATPIEKCQHEWTMSGDSFERPYCRKCYKEHR